MYRVYIQVYTNTCLYVLIYVLFVAHMYGTADRQREGFPHIMKSVFVSCKSGRGISELRDVVFDVASQVKENTGGCVL